MKLRSFFPAKEDFDRALKLKPDHLTAKYERGKCLYRMRRFSLAIADFNEVLLERPPRHQAYFYRGMCYFQSLQYAAAADDFTQAIERVPQKSQRDYAVYHYNLGNARAYQKKHTDAVGAYTRAVQLSPKMTAAWANRAQTYFKLGLYAAAEKDYNRAITTGPPKAELYFNRGRLYHHYLPKKRAKALDDYSAVLKKTPNHRLALDARAFYYLENYDIAKARGDLEKRLETNPTFDVEKRLLFILLYERGLDPAAQEKIDTLIEKIKKKTNSGYDGDPRAAKQARFLLGKLSYEELIEFSNTRRLLGGLSRRTHLRECYFIAGVKEFYYENDRQARHFFTKTTDTENPRTTENDYAYLYLSTAILKTVLKDGRPHTILHRRNDTRLSLYVRGIRQLENIHVMQALADLNLGYNQLTTLNGLTRLKVLTSLNLSNNRFEAVPEVKGLNRLTTLNISHNRLQTAVPLFRLPGLQTLNISYNKISSVAGIGRLTRLLELDAGKNNLKQTPGLDQLVRLKKLNLAKNRLFTLDALKTLTQLKHLNVSDNELVSLPDLSPLTALTELNLRGNNLFSLKGVDTLSNCVRIDLSANRLIEAGPFVNTVSAQIILISDNGLRAIPRFGALPDIKIIDLRRNRLQTLENLETFKNAKKLTLKLKGNAITQGQWLAYKKQHGLTFACDLDQ